MLLFSPTFHIREAGPCTSIILYMQCKLVTKTRTLIMSLLKCFLVLSLCVSVASTSNASTSDDKTITANDGSLSNDEVDAKFIRKIQNIAKSLKACGLKKTFTPKTFKWKKVMLRNSSATCNDGSDAGYYVRHSIGSKKWIIFLEGGGYCFDKNSCDKRFMHQMNFMSSKYWPEERSFSGILSPDHRHNPYWFDANHVYVPYCSSDSWTGTVPKGSAKDSYAFMGSYIVEEVILDLLTQGLFEARKVYLAGGSAGGTGVILNVDRVADMMTYIGSRADVRGIADSGWFFDNQPFADVICTSPHSCAPVEAIKRGIKLWKGRVADRCKPQFTSDDEWKCYFGYRAYPFIKAPIFIIQYNFDTAQITIDKAWPAVTIDHWRYIQKLGKEVMKTFENVSALFAPSCLNHEILIKPNWKLTKIRGISLPQALRCWEEQKHEHNHHHHHPSHHHHKLKSKWSIKKSKYKMLLRKMINFQRNDNARNLLSSKPLIDKTDFTSSDSLITNNPSSRSQSHMRHFNRRRKIRRRKNRNRRKKNRRGRKNKQMKSLFKSNDHNKHRLAHHKNGCHHRLIDICSWPHCNPTCPNMPFHLEPMSFKRIFTNFHIDLHELAKVFEVDYMTFTERIK
ncbi:Palmitoleoyl-protein carboxylesterase notum1 [Nymphon striatum]|nr:Palmitoleoyl-protein carboxylesterase notum1 [Nymphon striatum]